MCNDFYIFFSKSASDWLTKDQSEASHSMKFVVIVTNLIGNYLSTCIAGTSREKNRHRYSGVPVVGPPGFFFIPPADRREWPV